MKSTTETGHAKNVANFEDMISFCVGYGAIYNPVNANKKIAALQAKQTAALAAIQTVNTSRTVYNNATNAREIIFSTLKKLSTRIVNALEATTATQQTIDDAKTANRKIQGGKASKKVPLPVVTNPVTPESKVQVEDKSHSVSQQSYDGLVDNFSKLVQVVATEPSYVPNENELKVATLNTLITSLRASNTAVIIANTMYSNMRISRNTVLYGTDTGLVDIAAEVKKYVKSLYGSTSAQYKQLTGLKFSVPTNL